MRVLVFGTFDLLHPGHVFVLTEAAKRGTLFVIVARATNVEHIKGKPPVDDDETRVRNVRTVVPSATVSLGDSGDFLAPVRRVRPDLILLGYDQRLPPGVTDQDLPCTVERLPAFEPARYKTRLLRERPGI